LANFRFLRVAVGRPRLKYFLSLEYRMTIASLPQFCLNNKIISFSCTLQWDAKKKKKFPIEMPNWKAITTDNLPAFHDSNKNAFAIATGSINGIIVIDTDETKACKAGFPIDKDVLSALESASNFIVKTPNGRHFYFRYDDMIKTTTGACWNGIKNDFIDIRADGACVFAPPSFYLKDNSKCEYSIIKGNIECLMYSNIQTVSEDIKNALVVPRRTIPKEMEEYIESTDDEIVVELLNALSPKRWDNYSDWIQIGMILFNSNISLEVWDKFSRCSTHYEYGVCAKFWRSFNKRNLTIRSLWKLVKEDDPATFKVLQMKHINVKVLLRTSTHLSIANLFKALRPDDYLYSTDHGWYERMPNNVWKKGGKGEPCSQILAIAETIIPICQDYWHKAKILAENASSEDIKNFNIEEMKAFSKVQNSLQQASFIKSVQQFLPSMYKNDEFFDMLDSNIALFAFNNGVYDLNEDIFRPIQPEDCISFTCNYDYTTSRNDKVRLEILEWFKSMFGSEEMCSYFLKKIAYQLHGLHKLQEVDFWKGKGANGKSQVMRLIGKCFGNYCKSIPITYFTEKDINKDGALPALAGTRGARIIWATEPEAETTLQISLLKGLSGSDPIKVRGMYKEGFVYTPQCGLIILTNDFPKIPKTELSALQRRFIFMPFPYQFLDAPVAENHRKVNMDYIEKVISDAWRDEFINILIDLYRSEIKGCNSFIKPVEVINETKELFETANPITNWVRIALDTNMDNSFRMTPTELCNLYNGHIDTRQRVDNRRFGSLMNALGFHSKQSNGKLYYFGIREKEPSEEG